MPTPLQRAHAQEIMSLGRKLVEARQLYETLSLQFTNALERYENTPDHEPWVKHSVEKDANGVLAQLSIMRYDALLAALQETHGNIAHTAKLMGTNRTTIYRWCARYQVSPEDFKSR